MFFCNIIFVPFCTNVYKLNYLNQTTLFYFSSSFFKNLLQEFNFRIVFYAAWYLLHKLYSLLIKCGKLSKIHVF